LAFHQSRTSDFRSGYGRLGFRYVRAVGIGLALLVTASFMFKLGFLARSFVVMFGFIQVAMLFAVRFSVMELIKRSKRVDDHRILIVGCGQQAVAFARTLRERSPWNNRFLGHVRVSGEEISAAAQPIVGKLRELAKVLDAEVVDEVVFAVPGRGPEEFEDALTACNERGVDVLLTMPPSVPSSGKMEIANVTGFNMPMLGLSRTPTGEARLILKRVLDIVGALAGLVLTAPILLATALAVRLESTGPILFRQVRCGRNGRKFQMLKFRSMCADAEKMREELMHLNEMDGPVFKIKHDPRITKVGRFIRKTSIDELPQLFNVLFGHMSLVGPRPPLPSEVAQYKPWQRRRLSVRPGITGMWQVSGRNQIDFEEWMQLDLKYIDNWSLWLDVKILFQTVPVVLLHKGAS
jgi:exopolysaccharide biosynthesis polyprenyl glycosylphosphotransferase